MGPILQELPGPAGSDRLSFMLSALAHPCLLPLSQEGWSLSAQPLLSPHFSAHKETSPAQGGARAPGHPGSRFLRE